MYLLLNMSHFSDAHFSKMEVRPQCLFACREGMVNPILPSLYPSEARVGSGQNPVAPQNPSLSKGLASCGFTMWHYNVFIIKYIKIIIARLSFHDRHNVNKPVSSSIVVTILHRMAQLSPGGCIKCKQCRSTLMAQLGRGLDGSLTTLIVINLEDIF